jgi:glucose/arabinose dehydrogenase
LDNIPGAAVHDGGRLRFGPDKMLYISTGDARDVTSARNNQALSGKILRIQSNGSIPSDNPEPGKPWFIKGLRNPQGFDWLNSDTLVIADNGPTGEYQSRTGGDEINLAQKGNDLGWPTTWHCEAQAGLTTPILTWIDAMPPGGLLYYSGSSIPSWKGSILVASTGAEHLHRIILKENGAVERHEVYFQEESSLELGRLRTVVQGPEGEIYVTTSNCDGRGTCPPQQDGIYRILPSS